MESAFNIFDKNETNGTLRYIWIYWVNPDCWMIMIEISDFNISFFSCKDAARFLQSYLVLSQSQFYLFVLLSWAHGKGATCINGIIVQAFSCLSPAVRRRCL